MTDTTTMTESPEAGPAEGALIKTDRLGRMRFSREQRERILDAFEASGSSGADFARIHGVKYQTLTSWVQKRRRERGEYADPGEAVAPALPARFAEIELGGEDAGSPSTPLILKLPANRIAGRRS